MNSKTLKRVVFVGAQAVDIGHEFVQNPEIDFWPSNWVHLNGVPFIYPSIEVIVFAFDVPPNVRVKIKNAAKNNPAIKIDEADRESLGYILRKYLATNDVPKKLDSETYSATQKSSSEGAKIAWGPEVTQKLPIFDLTLLGSEAESSLGLSTESILNIATTLIDAESRLRKYYGYEELKTTNPTAILGATTRQRVSIFQNSLNLMSVSHARIALLRLEGYSIRSIMQMPDAKHAGVHIMRGLKQLASSIESLEKNLKTRSTRGVELLKEREAKGKPLSCHELLMNIEKETLEKIIDTLEPSQQRVLNYYFFPFKIPQGIENKRKLQAADIKGLAVACLIERHLSGLTIPTVGAESFADLIPRLQANFRANIRNGARFARLKEWSEKRNYAHQDTLTNLIDRVDKKFLQEIVLERTFRKNRWHAENVAGRVFSHDVFINKLSKEALQEKYGISEKQANSKIDRYKQYILVCLLEINAEIGYIPGFEDFTKAADKVKTVLTQVVLRRKKTKKTTVQELCRLYGISPSA